MTGQRITGVLLIILSVATCTADAIWVILLHRWVILLHRDIFLPVITLLATNPIEVPRAHLSAALAMGLPIIVSILLLAVGINLTASAVSGGPRAGRHAR